MLLDTNALFLPFTHGTDLDREVARWAPEAEVVVPSSALEELDRLARRGVPAVALARTLAKRYPHWPASAKGDQAVLELAERHGAWVVTADRALRDRLSARGLRVLVPRDRNRLAPYARRATVKRAARVVRPSGRASKHGT